MVQTTIIVARVILIFFGITTCEFFGCGRYFLFPSRRNTRVCFLVFKNKRKTSEEDSYMQSTYRKPYRLKGNNCNIDSSLRSAREH
jgi:hypothetical protein